MKQEAVHLVIPCYRESGRLQAFLEPLCHALAHLGSVSVLVVDDGSGLEEADRLHAIVEAARAHHPFVREMFRLRENIGKGATVYAGWRNHLGEPWLMFADADGAVPAREVTRLIVRARSDRSLQRAYFASRVKMLGRNVQRVWYRELMGHAFHALVAGLLGERAHDTQCGCKIVPREFFERALDSLSLPGFAFDVELMLGLRAAGCALEEVPVDWREVSGGKLRLMRDSWSMFRDVMRLRQRYDGRKFKGDFS
ncbi:MAG: glycosyltransferase [Roseimicrobium sp.]